MNASHFGLTPEQLDLRSSAGRFAQRRYGAVADRWNRESTMLPSEERLELARQGYLGMGLPEAYGGGGGTLLDSLTVIEEIAKVSPIPAFSVFEANTGPARVIDLFGTEAQKERWIPEIVEGRATMAVCISEPDAGSAATDMRTRGVVEGDEVVINGLKRWTSGAGHAELYLVYLRLSDEVGAKSIGAVVVDAGTPGMTVGAQERLMGFHGIGSADITFDDVRVPVDNIVIQPGGFNKLFQAFSIERLGNATMSLAIGQACLDRCATYVQERQQFGRPIAEFQLVQQALADIIISVEATRLLITRAATGAGRGSPEPFEASIAKCHANEMAKRASDLALQIHGGYGYSEEYGIERMVRDSFGWALGGGTPAIQRTRIVSEFLGRSFNQRAG